MQPRQNLASTSLLIRPLEESGTTPEAPKLGMRELLDILRAAPCTLLSQDIRSHVGFLHAVIM